MWCRQARFVADPAEGRDREPMDETEAQGLAGLRVGVVDHAVAVLVGTAGSDVASGPVAVVPRHLPGLRVVRRDVEGPGVADRAPGRVDADILRGATAGGRALEVDLEPLDALPGDDVDHPGNGVGAVDRGRAVLQDLVAADHGARHGCQVDGVGGAAYAGGTPALAVYQHERALCAETAQGDGPRSRSAVGDEAGEGVVDLLAGGHRRGLQDVGGVEQTREGGGLARDHRDGRCAGELVAADAGSGDEDFFYRPGFRGGGVPRPLRPRYRLFLAVLVRVPPPAAHARRARTLRRTLPAQPEMSL